jgi:hypothetical protein
VSVVALAMVEMVNGPVDNTLPSSFMLNISDPVRFTALRMYPAESVDPCIITRVMAEADVGVVTVNAVDEM